MAIPHDQSTATATSTNPKEMTLSSLESASFWANVALVLFSLLAATSAMFALYFSTKVGAAKDAELNRFKQQSSAAIANAEARGAEANEKAAEASAGLARSNEEIARLTLESAKTTERTAVLSLEVEKESRKRAEAERALLELQQRVKPRSLTTSEYSSLTSALTRSPIKGPVEVMHSRGW
jgi:chromosome segregation ATPase